MLQFPIAKTVSYLCFCTPDFSASLATIGQIGRCCSPENFPHWARTRPASKATGHVSLAGHRPPVCCTLKRWPQGRSQRTQRVELCELGLFARYFLYDLLFSTPSLHSLFAMREAGLRFKDWGPNFWPWMLFGDLSFYIVVVSWQISKSGNCHFIRVIFSFVFHPQSDGMSQTGSFLKAKNHSITW